MRIGFAQIDARIGDFHSNAKKILSAYRECVEKGAELVITPELAICGYPPGDLIFDRDFVPLNLQARDYLALQAGDVPMAVGHVDHATTITGNNFTNTASLLQNGKVEARADKCLLPAFERFNETRYFYPAPRPTVWRIGRYRVGVAIGEDLWTEEASPLKLFTDNPANELAQKGADVIINMTSSPFHRGKPEKRATRVAQISAELRKPIALCNSVGVSDEWIFDGYSLATHARGEVNRVLPGFREACEVVDVALWEPEGRLSDRPTNLMHAIALGIRETVLRSGFDGAAVFLDDSVDSAIGAAITKEALGSDSVHLICVIPPDADENFEAEKRDLAERLKLKLRMVSVEDALEMLQLTMQPITPEVTPSGLHPGLASLVFHTMAEESGFCPIHCRNRTSVTLQQQRFCLGDQAFNPLGDLRVSHLVELANWLNQFGNVIADSWLEDPSRGFESPEGYPLESADQILHLLNDESMTPQEIIDQGIPAKLVTDLVNRVGFQTRPPALRVVTSPSALGSHVPSLHEWGIPDPS